MAQNFGLLCLTHGLLWSIVTSYFGLLGLPDMGVSKNQGLCYIPKTRLLTKEFPQQALPIHGHSLEFFHVDLSNHNFMRGVPRTAEDGSEGNSDGTRKFHGLAWLFFGVRLESSRLYDQEHLAYESNFPEHFRFNCAVSRNKDVIEQVLSLNLFFPGSNQS